MNRKIKNTQSYNYISAIFAFILWGGWSFYVNAQVGFKAGLVSGLTQGICSFMITLFIAYLIEKQFNFYQNDILKLCLPPVCTVLLTGSCLVAIHHFIGTPNIIKTLVPVLTVAFLFAVVTNFKLYKTQKSHITHI